MRVAVPSLGPVWLIEIRVLFAGLVLLPLSPLSDLGREIKNHFLPLLVIGCLNFAFPFVFFAFGSQFLPAGFSAILNATAPLFGTLVTWIWLKEKFTLRKIIGFALGFSGVIILVGWKTVALTPTLVLAIMAGLSAALMYAIAAPYAKQKLAGVSPLSISTVCLLAASLILLPLLPLTKPAVFPPLGAILAAIALAIFSTALAYILYFQLIKNIGATQTLTVTYLIPLFALVWGWFFLGEPLTVSMVFGGGLILSGVAISLR